MTANANAPTKITNWNRKKPVKHSVFSSQLCAFWRSHRTRFNSCFVGSVCVFEIISFQCVLSILASINHDGVMLPLSFHNLWEDLLPSDWNNIITVCLSKRVARRNVIKLTKIKQRKLKVIYFSEWLNQQQLVTKLAANRTRYIELTCSPIMSKLDVRTLCLFSKVEKLTVMVATQ